ncbi:MAG: hypothetical protein AB1649_05665 [Chloroflexota bacterium]
MDVSLIWSALEESFDILGERGYPAMDKVANELNVAPGWISWVAAAMFFKSESFTTLQFMRMFPYGSVQLYEERFAFAVQQGYLMSDGKDRYCATESGLSTARQIFAAADQSIVSLHPLPDQQLLTLNDILYRIAETSFAAPGPPAHYLLDHKRNVRGLPVTELINFFERYVSELQGFRDDLYVASWGAHQIHGHTWDAFDQLVQSGALTFDDLYAKVKRRGVTRELLSENLKELIGRGWVEENADAYLVTTHGKRIREEAEALADKYFFAPWSCLNESELKELSNLSMQLRDGLKGSRQK